MKKSKNVVVIIPAYNEEHSIGHVVAGVLKLKGIKRCIVVDDGSTDSTAILAKRAGVLVISTRKNVGAGAATALGLRHAVRQRAGVCVLLDGDGQHDPKHIPELLRAFTDGIDVVIASRYIQKTRDSTSLIRKIGSGFISQFIAICFHTRIYDPTSGFRALNSRAISLLTGRYPVIFPEPEAIVYLFTHHYGIKELSVEMKPRLYGKSSIGPMKALGLMVYIIGAILVERFKTLVQRRH